VCYILIIKKLIREGSSPLSYFYLLNERDMSKRKRKNKPGAGRPPGPVGGYKDINYVRRNKTIRLPHWLWERVESLKNTNPTECVEEALLAYRPSWKGPKRTDGK